MAFIAQYQLKEIFDLLTTNIIIIDTELTLCYANMAAQQLFSLRLSRGKKINLQELLPHCSLNIHRLQHELYQHRSFIDNCVVVNQDEMKVYLSLTAQLLDNQYILLEFYLLNQQNKLTTEHLQQQQQTASQELLRGLAHEIKNPLGALRGAAQLLEKELSATSHLIDYTSLIIQQADRLGNLVNQLLGPQHIPQKSSNNIHQVTERIFKLISLEKPQQITIERDYDPSIPEMIFDPEQIEQILLNIARNALQATQTKPKGKIIIRTRTVFQITMHGKRHRLCAKISIEDNGIGVPEHIQDTLFYPMVTGHANGTGLGLSIARTLADQHQGKIEMTSTADKTIFSLYLPIY